MKIWVNFVDLKDKNACGEGNGLDNCAENAIKEMFALHYRSSLTMWDRKMFDEEFKREGSGFFILFTNDDISGISSRDIPGHGKIEFSYDDKLKLASGSKIIGFFIFYTVVDEMHILDITVDKKLQSNGMGSFMLGYIIKKYPEKGIKSFFLEVRVSNVVAIKLYKKFGFEIFLLRKGYYDDNKEDALCMVKDLEVQGIG